MNRIHNSLSEWLSTPIPSGHFRRYRFFFSFKIFLTSLLLYPFHWGIGRVLLLIYLTLAVISAGAKKNYWIGTALLFFFTSYHLYRTFPLTINHYFWEPLILALIILYPAPEPAKGEVYAVDGTCCHIIQAGILTVWFFSGIQKLFHGYFLNGEMFALTTLFGTATPLSHSLRFGLDGLSKIAGHPIFPFHLPIVFPPTLEHSTFHIPVLAKVYFLGLSWATLFVEIVLPIAALFKRLRQYSLFLLILFQILLGVLSHEFDIGLTVMAGLLLFFPKQSKWTYPAFGVLAIIVTVVQAR